MTSAETFFNTPGSVDNFLAWAGGLGPGDRGSPPSREMPASMQITGTDEVVRNLADYIKAVPEIVQSELAGYAEKGFQESLKQVPWETTHLQQTGTIEQDPDNENVIRVGYGGSEAPYAIRQHEDMTFHHPKPNTKAKYLEDPFMELVPEIAPGIVAQIDYYFSQGVPSMSGMRGSLRSSLGNLAGRYV